MLTICDFPNYVIDEDGNVYRKKDMKMIKPEINKTGYVSIGLSYKGISKRLFVHRLVAQAYIPNPDKLPCINHKDENKLNNNVSNLEWCTHKYNNFYGNSKPTIKAVNARKKPVIQLTLSGEIIDEFESASYLMHKKGYDASNISACCNGKLKTAYGYKWKFKEIR